MIRGTRLSIVELIIGVGLAFVLLAYSVGAEAAPKRTIAIMPIALKANAVGAAGGAMNVFALIASEKGQEEALRSAEGTGSAATDMLITALSKSGEFVIVERGQAEKILTEQGFGLTGAVDASSAAKIGKILGAQAVVLGVSQSWHGNQEVSSLEGGWVPVPRLSGGPLTSDW